MATAFGILACYLLAFSFPVALTGNSTVTPAITTAVLNQTYTTAIITPTNTTAPVTAFSNSTENTTPFTSTASKNETSTKNTVPTTGSTGQFKTSQSTTNTTALTNSTEVTTTPGTHKTTFTALTTPTNQTTVGDISTPDTTVTTTANSSQTVNTTSVPVDTTTQGLGLNMSDVNMTIIFSVVLGGFALSLVLLIFHKCRHKIQYLHQPLNNTDNTDAFVADNDTLVISGGLYDDHPIYDNVPTATDNQSQFRLEFLH